ncbi:retrotransposon protein, putative, ty1-copia subclass [Tanacetum coccineum]
MFPVLSRMAIDVLSVQATSVAFESAFSTSGRVLSIRRTKLTPSSLEMCMCLKDHLDAQERKQDTSTLENALDFEDEVLDAEVQENEATPLSDEEIALDVKYARVMIELRADVELKYNIIVAMPKITREGHYTCNVRVEYEWKPPRCSSCKVFGHIHEECPKNTGAGEKKIVMKPSLTSRGVPVGLKMGFKPQKEYQPVPKKPTASSSGNKKKGVEPTIEVSNSNPFDVLNSVNNDVEFGTNEGTTNLVNNRATSSGSSLMNVDNSSSGITPIIDKIGKFEDLLTSGQTILVDKYGNPLKKVEFSGEYDSEDEVASVDNDMAHSMASEMEYEQEFPALTAFEHLDSRTKHDWKIKCNTPEIWSQRNDEILEDHFDGDRGNDTIEDNADLNPSTNVYLDVNQNTSIP